LAFENGRRHFVAHSVTIIKLDGWMGVMPIPILWSRSSQVIHRCRWWLLTKSWRYGHPFGPFGRNRHWKDLPFIIYIKAHDKYHIKAKRYKTNKEGQRGNRKSSKSRSTINLQSGHDSCHFQQLLDIDNLLSWLLFGSLMIATSLLGINHFKIPPMDYGYIAFL
jgi:hypothetical protein